MTEWHTIETEADVAEGADWLARACPRLAHALQMTGPPPLRRRADGFEALFNAIVSQQVSVASAKAIWTKLEVAGMTDAKAIRHTSPENLRALGLSRQKARYAKALADARIDFDALRGASDEHVVKTLVAVPGIGVWTAEIYAMFSLGRPDVFAAGDLALQEAARELYGLDARPTEAQLRMMAADWSPWRSVAARLLFAYYRVIKQREGVS
ncbi:MAG: DNA-3-methyladenine glycosylase [Pseudomonadota bacterium]